MKNVLSGRVERVRDRGEEGRGGHEVSVGTRCHYRVPVCLVGQTLTDQAGSGSLAHRINLVDEQRCDMIGPGRWPSALDS